MTQQDRDRLIVLKKAQKEWITQCQAATELELTERHVRRLLSALKAQGDGAVLHGLRGRPSNHKLSEQVREQIVRIVSQEYPDFGPTLVSEYLAKRHQVRIGREALVNACRHSRASNIEVVLEYGAKQLRILVRDNGCGIDPQVLRSGREGHWGISGMRERAEEIGARLKVWSGADAGTEVELSIPSDIAFESHSSERQPGWLAKLYPRKVRADIIIAKKREK